MELPIRRVYKGNMTIPDFVTEYCILNNKNIKCSYKGESMTLTPENLAKDIIKKGPKNHILALPINIISSNHDRIYGLYHYKWKPDEKASRS